MSIIKNKLKVIEENIKEELFIAMLFGSLPEPYNSLKNTFDSRPEKDLTLSLIKGEVINKYRKRTSNFSMTNEAQGKALKT